MCCHIDLGIIDPFKACPLDYPFQFWKNKQITRSTGRRMRWMAQCGDLPGDQKLFYVEGYVNLCIAMVQYLSFACSQSPSLLTIFIHTTSQVFLIKVLIICLSLRCKLLMREAMVAKKKGSALPSFVTVACESFSVLVNPQFSIGGFVVQSVDRIEKSIIRLL